MSAVVRRRRVQEGSGTENAQPEDESLLDQFYRDGPWVHEDPRCASGLCYCACSREGDPEECGCPPDPICECSRPSWACSCRPG